MNATSRKHYLVLPSYQIRLVGFLIMIIFLGSMIHGFFLYKITSKSIEDGFFSAHNRLRSTWEILKPAIVVTNGLSFLLISLAMLVVTVLSSHRLIGPLVKIAGRIRELASGRLDLPPLRLRQGDEGQLLSEAVNDLQKEFQRRLGPLVRIKAAIDSGKTLSDSDLRAGLSGALDGLSFESPDETAEQMVGDRK